MSVVFGVTRSCRALVCLDPVTAQGAPGPREEIEDVPPVRGELVDLRTKECARSTALGRRYFERSCWRRAVISPTATTIAHSPVGVAAQPSSPLLERGCFLSR